MKKHYPKTYLYKRIVQSKLFIDKNYSDSIDLNNIADEVYFSKFHFIRLFKTIYGRTPHQYLTKVRIEHAIQLLQKGMSVTDTSFFAGFTSLSSFTELFKRYINMSPSAYQRQYLESKDQIKKTSLQFIPTYFAAQKGWR